MADIDGCFAIFELPFMIFDVHKRGGNSGCAAIIIVAGLIGGGISYFKKPDPPPIPITTKIKREVEKHVPHPINNWKIKRAEKKYKKKMEEARLEAERQAKLVEKEPAGTAAIDSTTNPRWRDRAKDWMRDKLNDDYKERHPEEKDQ